MRRHVENGKQAWWQSELCQEALVMLVFLSGVVVMALLSWFLTFRVLDQVSGPAGPQELELTINGGDHLTGEVFGDAPCAVICRDPTGGKTK